MLRFSTIVSASRVRVISLAHREWARLVWDDQQSMKTGLFWMIFDFDKSLDFFCLPRIINKMNNIDHLPPRWLSEIPKRKFLWNHQRTIAPMAIAWRMLWIHLPSHSMTHSIFGSVILQSNWKYLFDEGKEQHAGDCLCCPQNRSKRSRLKLPARNTELSNQTSVKPKTNDAFCHQHHQSVSFRKLECHPPRWMKVSSFNESNRWVIHSNSSQRILVTTTELRNNTIDCLSLSKQFLGQMMGISPSANHYGNITHRPANHRIFTCRQPSQTESGNYSVQIVF